MLHKIIRGIAPVFALAAAAGLSGCDGKVLINGEEGVPLADLDIAGKTPSDLVLAGPDRVVVRSGDALKIDVSGDPAAAAALRFTLDGEALGIMRKKGKIEGNGKATVTVTMPGLEKLVLAGSGAIEADALAGSPEVVIAGSGTAGAARVDASQLEVTIAGSGTFRASGTADVLELTVAGSGTADMAGLKADEADVTIAGSGKAAFASDGTVKANIMGSGEVTVAGSAKCTIKSMGSGKLNCTNAPNPPEAPAAPATPGAPTPPVPPVPPVAPTTE